MVLGKVPGYFPSDLCVPGLLHGPSSDRRLAARFSRTFKDSGLLQEALRTAKSYFW